MVESFESEGWIEILRDTSQPMKRRLEAAITDPSFDAWVIATYSFGTELETESMRSLPDPETVPARTKLHKGIGALKGALELLSGNSLDTVAADFAEVEPHFTAVLTNPAVPEIVGDELALLIEGFAAGVAAQLMLDNGDDRELADTLAEVFALRMERAPRLLVLSLVGSGKMDCLREGWHDVVSAEDLEILDRDVAAAATHVTNLRRIVGTKM